MDDNWIVENLEGAFATWNSKLTEIWSLVSETPQHFKNGAIWAVCQNINTALQAIGYGLLNMDNKAPEPVQEEKCKHKEELER